MVDAAYRLCADVEQIVRKFPRFHRYQTGALLRQRADDVVEAATQTWFDLEERWEWACRLVKAIDNFKARLQVCKRIRALRDFSQFEKLLVDADNLGSQAGGWKRSIEQHPNTQNAQANGIAQRGERLSTRTARSRANK